MKNIQKKFPHIYRIIGATIFLSLFLNINLGAEYSTGRTWLYMGADFNFATNWSFTIMPGHKYEYYNDSGSELHTFLYELFAGPTWSINRGNLKIKIPFWYYYLGFPYRFDKSYHSNHNIAILPTLTYKYNNWSFSSRTFFYNTLYSGFYDTSKERWGYSLLITQMLGISFNIWKKISLMVADEVFWGAIEDGQAEATSGPGFYRNGFSKNKLYMGIKTMWHKTFIKCNYVYETNYDSNHNLTRTDHYIYLVLMQMIQLSHN